MNLLAVVALVLALGVTAQVLADRHRIPSVLFLIAAGIAIGPEGLGLVSADTFGGGLHVIVGVSVGIILFDGAFQLRIDRLEEAPTATLRLVTVGALVMWLGTATAVRVFLDVSWGVSLLVGALLIATGPTVITPILNVVTVRDHVAAALESEGIVNDVSAAILAVVVYEVLVTSSSGSIAILPQFAWRLGVGLGVGLGVAAVVWAALARVDGAPRYAPLHSRLIVLVGIIGAVAVAETVSSETGVAAAATAGFVLGNVDLPHREDVESFLEDLTVIVLAFVFVALAALIRFDDILALGLAGVLVVAVVTLLVRPVLVYLSAAGVERFTRNERLYLSFVGPRGIIPASIATLYAGHLQAADQSEAAQVLAGTVFLIIFVTVVFQAGLARHAADYLDVIPMYTIIVGGGRVGRTLARRLQEDGENVVLIESNPDTVERLQSDGLEVVQGDGTDADVLETAGAERAKTVVAATPDDDLNLLVCQLASTTFDVETVASRVNDPSNVEAFEALGVRAIDLSMATAWSLENVIERPALSEWMNELGRTGDVQEIEVTAEDLVDRSIASVNEDIPDGCIVGLVTRDGESHVPTGDDVLQYGDHVTFLGEVEAVDRAVKRFHPHE